MLSRKSTTPRVDIPTWDLMMKNFYNIGAYQVNREDFRLDITYEDTGRGDRKRFLPSSNLQNQPLIQVFASTRSMCSSILPRTGFLISCPTSRSTPQRAHHVSGVGAFRKTLAEKIDDPPSARATSTTCSMTRP